MKALCILFMYTPLWPVMWYAPNNREEEKIYWCHLVRRTHSSFLISKILRLNSLENLWGNSNINFLVIKPRSVSLVFKENCAKTWKSLQTLCPRVFLFFFTSLTMYWMSTNDEFLIEKSKMSSQIMPCCNCKSI